MIEAERAGSKWENLPGFDLPLQARTAGRRTRHSSEKRRGHCYLRLTPQHGGARAGAGAKAKMEGGRDYAFRLGREHIEKIDEIRDQMGLDSRSAALRAIIEKS